MAEKKPTDSSGQTAPELAAQAGVTPEQLAAQEAIDPTQTPDAAVGGAVMNQPDTPPAFVKGPEDSMSSTSDAAVKKEEDLGTQIDSAASAVTGVPTPTPAGTTAPEVADTQSTLSATTQSAYDSAFDILDNMASTAEADRQSALDNIEKQRDVSLKETSESQRMESGQISKALGRIGAYGGSGSGIAYAQSLSSSHRLETEKLKAAWSEAIHKAKVAYDQKDLDLANQLMNTASSYENQLVQQRRVAMEEVKFAQDVLKFERDNDAATFESLIAQGYTVDDVPDGYFSSVDEKSGWQEGTSRGLFVLQEEERKDIRTKTDMEQATELMSVLNTVPIGQPVTIGENTYYGTSGAGAIEIDGDGNGKTYEVNQETGEITVRDLGKIGNPKDGWTPVETDQGLFSFNPRTNEYKPAYGTPSEWDFVIPEGADFSTVIDPTTGKPFNGYCGEFIRYVSGVRVGDTLAKKIEAMDPKMKAEDVVAGDVVTTSEGTGTGHVFVVNETFYDGDGNLTYRISEANYSAPGIVTHNRTMRADSPLIKGLQKGDVQENFITGTDSSRVRLTTFGTTEDGTLGQNASEIALDIINPLSGQRLGDIPTKGGLRSQVSKELTKLREEAIAGGDMEGTMLASAGGKDVGEEFIKSFNKGLTVVGQISDLQNLFEEKNKGKYTRPDGEEEKWDLSPIIGEFEKRNPWDGDAQAIKAQLTAIIPNLARGIYGEVGVLTDNDVRLYAQTLPNLTSTENVKKAVLSLTMRTVQRSLENNIKISAKGGRDMSGYVGIYEEIKAKADRLLQEAGGDVEDSFRSQVVAQGFDYDAMIAAGHTDEEIRESLNL